MRSPREAVIIRYFVNRLVGILSPSNLRLRLIVIEGGATNTWLGSRRCGLLTITRGAAQAPSKLAGEFGQLLVTPLVKRGGPNLPLKILQIDNWKRGL